MTRLLHTADWQIGRYYNVFDPEDAALLADARFKAIERLASLANEHAVDAVLVAGDVFDAQGVADRTIHRMFHAMNEFAGQWILISGNHDAALAESVWTRATRLKAIPENVATCLSAQPLLLEHIGIAILPAPLTQRHTHVDLTEWFADAQTPPGLLRVGIAHGSVQGILADTIDSANPIAADRAQQARLDYLALGDWHGTKQIDARTWYSGTPETDRFKANDSGQALLVELDAESEPRVTALATGQYRWHIGRFNIEVATDVEQTLAAIRAYAACDVVNLEISGRVDLESHQRLTAAIEQARGRVRGLILDLSALQLEPTASDIEALQADGYLGEVIGELRARQHGDDAERARDALALLARLLGEQRNSGGVLT